MLEASDDGLGAQHGRAGFCCENRVLRLDSGSEAAFDVFCPGPTSATTEALTPRNPLPQRRWVASVQGSGDEEARAGGHTTYLVTTTKSRWMQVSM